jgi:hypothetical protein
LYGMVAKDNVRNEIVLVWVTLEAQVGSRDWSKFGYSARKRSAISIDLAMRGWRSTFNKLLAVLRKDNILDGVRRRPRSTDNVRHVAR